MSFTKVARRLETVLATNVTGNHIRTHNGMSIDFICLTRTQCAICTGDTDETLKTCTQHNTLRQLVESAYNGLDGVNNMIRAGITLMESIGLPHNVFINNNSADLVPAVFVEGQLAVVGYDIKTRTCSIYMMMCSTLMNDVCEYVSYDNLVLHNPDVFARFRTVDDFIQSAKQQITPNRLKGTIDRLYMELTRGNDDVSDQMRNGVQQLIRMYSEDTKYVKGTNNLVDDRIEYLTPSEDYGDMTSSQYDINFIQGHEIKYRELAVVKFDTAQNTSQCPNHVIRFVPLQSFIQNMNIYDLIFIVNNIPDIVERYRTNRYTLAYFPTYC
jgi:hypothetical protein